MISRRSSDAAPERPVASGTLFRSAFGRRIFLMFCVAALIPGIVVFWMTYRTAAVDAEVTGRAALRSQGKGYAMRVFERLDIAAGMLERLPAASGGDVQLLAPFFRETVPLAVETTGGTQESRDLRRRILEQAALQPASDLLVLPAAPGGRLPEVVLLRRESGSGATLAGVLHPEFVWGRADEFPGASRICVYADTRQLYCHGARPDQAAAVLRDEWTLFLKPRFSAGEWRFEASIEQAPALAKYSRFLAPIAAGVLLLVLLLSTVQVRRILVPLESLLERIKAVGHGHVGRRTGGRSMARIEESDDSEFGALARTFNAMGGRIDRQLDTLHTLSEIDRLILDGVGVAAVVELVIARVQRVLEDASVAIVLQGPGSSHYFLRPAGAQATETGDSVSLAPVTAIAYASHPGDGRWNTTAETGPAFEQAGVREVLLYTLGQRNDAQTWVALGFRDDTSGHEDALVEVRELAERIDVAIAASERENLLVFQARHDPLTDLPNRLAAFEALAEAIALVQGGGAPFTTVFLDLDRFKFINDGLGHVLGDRILVAAGQRIRESTRAGDFVARFGGDEFFVILHDVSETAAVRQVIDKISAAFARPLVVDGDEFTLQFSAGVAVYPRDGSSGAELVRNADVAMYRGKKAGGGRVEFFEEEMNTAALARVQLEGDLRRAIALGGIRVHYQPRVDSRSGRIVGAEALARWSHPERGWIPPDVFIPLAEESGLIDDLGILVLAETCRQLRAWLDAGLDLPLVAVNVSAHQLRGSDFAERVGALLAEQNLQATQLELEVTESVLVRQGGSAATQLASLREMGATIAIDDFGTGYSSLAYLAKLPTDTLKIDRAFMVEMETDSTAVAVVRSIIAMAQALHKRLVAEGVETHRQVALLADWGCHEIQGYVYYRPMPPEQLGEELARLQAGRTVTS